MSADDVNFRRCSECSRKGCCADEKRVRAGRGVCHRFHRSRRSVEAERDAAHRIAESRANYAEALAHRIQSARVEIPDLTPEDMERVTGREYFNGLRTGFELARSRARVVYPANDGDAP